VQERYQRFGKTFRSVAMGAVLFASASTAGDWTTYGHDPARSGWASDEKTLTPTNVPHLQMQWKTHVDNQSYSLSALTSPVVAGKVAYVAGVRGSVFAIDTRSGAVLWTRTLKSMTSARKGGLQGTFLCPEGITATPVIDNETNNLYVLAADGSLYGLDLGTGTVKFGPTPFVAPYAKAWSLNLVAGTVYTTVSLGCGNGRSGVYSADIRDPRRPAIRDVMLSPAYTAGIWGRGGAVIGANGRIYGGTADGDTNPQSGDYSDTVVAVSIPDLSVADYFLPADAAHLKKTDLDVGSASPVWLTWNSRNILAHGFKQGMVYLLDADRLGGRDHGTPLFTSPLLGNDKEACCDGSGIWGGLSSARDAVGKSWVYVPVGGPPSKQAPRFPITNGDAPHGSIMAFTIAADARTQNPTLDPAWISSDFNFPDPPVIANGVLFALSNGENPDQHGDESRRFLNTHPAVLKALDASTGKELYNSGAAISTWVHFSGLAVANGQVFAVDHDSNLYCFGLGDANPVSKITPSAHQQDQLSTSWIGRAERTDEFLKTWILRAGLSAAFVLLTALVGIWAGSRSAPHI
jgi:outer membrane protein assembly factor BamB